MAGNEENKKTLLRFSLLDADQQQSLKKLYGYGDHDNQIREKVLDKLQGRKQRSDVPSQTIFGSQTPTWTEGEKQEFLRDVKKGNILRVAFDIMSGMDVNAQDKFGMTALHYAAATAFRPCIRQLVKSGRCNYLLTDYKGRLASELAYEWGKDYAVGLLLQKKEVRQAYEESRLPPVATPSDDAP